VVADPYRYRCATRSPTGKLSKVKGASARKLSPKAVRVLAILVACLLVPVILLSQSSFAPFSAQVPPTDMAVFSWTAYRLEHGDRLYIDIWDHKGPAIYFLFMLGLKLGGGSLLGIWALLLLMLALSSYMCFSLLERLTSTKAAFVGALAFVMCLPQAIAEAGFLEDMTLIFIGIGIFASAELLLNEQPSTKQRVLSALAGLSLAAILMSRPNLAGPYLGIFIGLLIAAWQNREWGRRVVDAAIMLGAAAAGVAGCLFYVAKTSDVNAMRSAYLDYNVLYSHAPLRDRIMTFFRLGKLMVNPALGSVALFGGFLYTAWSLVRKSLSGSQREAIFWTSTLIGGLASVVLSIMSGRAYSHYATPWAPYIGLYAGLLFFKLYQVWTARPRPSWQGIAVGIFFALLSFQFMRVVARHRADIANSLEDANKLEVSRWIEQNTGPDDRILVWGDSGSIHWLTKRQSVTPYFYHLPLLSHGYDVASISDLVAALDRYKPKVIVDRTSFSQVKVGLKPGDWVQTDPLGKFYDRDVSALQAYVRDHYRELPPIGGTDVYVRQP
jgi:hypothetical protein